MQRELQIGTIVLGPKARFCSVVETRTANKPEQHGRYRMTGIISRIVQRKAKVLGEDAKSIGHHGEKGFLYEVIFYKRCCRQISSALYFWFELRPSTRKALRLQNLCPKCLRNLKDKPLLLKDLCPKCSTLFSRSRTK